MALRVGDILEFDVEGRLAYLHYVGRREDYGYGVRLLRQTYDSRPPNLEEVISEGGDIVFYPLGTALRQGFVRRVGSLPVAGSAGIDGPMRSRRYSQDRGREGWLVWIDGKQVHRSVLTPEEEQMPISGILNHAGLIHELLGREAQPDPGARVSRAGPEEEMGQVIHYVYSRSQSEATRVGQIFDAHGWGVEVRRSEADGELWLVRVSEDAASSSEETREEIADLARSHGAEYDGWEMRVT